MATELLKNYKLPYYYEGVSLSDSEVQSEREKMKNDLQKYVFGYLPKAPLRTEYGIEVIDKNHFGGKAVVEKITIILDTENGMGTFSFVLALPKNAEKIPVFVFPDFDLPFPRNYLPGEELIDEGFGFATFRYSNVAEDNNDTFFSKLPKLLLGDQRDEHACGSIGIWSWCCMRIADCLSTRKEVDFENLAIIGHSRLGKTALLTGALDHRFRFVFPNNSGCTGDALARALDHENGEDIAFITKQFPYWFCKKYAEYAGREEELPIDQHVLISLIAPNYICAGSAEEDRWASPDAEYLSYVAATPFFEACHVSGLIHPERMPEVGDRFLEGHLGFCRREGTHYLTRTDWKNYMTFFRKHRK